MVKYGTIERGIVMFLKLLTSFVLLATPFTAVADPTYFPRGYVQAKDLLACTTATQSETFVRKWKQGGTDSVRGTDEEYSWKSGDFKGNPCGFYTGLARGLQQIGTSTKLEVQKGYLLSIYIIEIERFGMLLYVIDTRMLSPK